MPDVVPASHDPDREVLGYLGQNVQQRSDFGRRHMKVLLIDDDQGTLDTFAIALRGAGVEVTTAASGSRGLEAAKQRRFDCVAIDLRLGDMSGIDVLRVLSGDADHPPVLLISAWLSTAAIVQAIKLGAFDVLEKPFDGETLIASISAAVAERQQPNVELKRLGAAKRHRSVAERWIMYVFKGCNSEGDPNTLELWAREIAVSYSTLCEICRLNATRPLDARDFVRVLRALRKATLARCAPDEFLAVSDRRTLKSLSARAGVNLEERVNTGSISDFLKHQQFIPSGSEALHVINELVGDL